ncbi:MAG: helix-turn-helix domain-containing protein [Bacteroidota bacterium]
MSAQEDHIQIPDSLKTQPFDTLQKKFYYYEFKDVQITEKYAEAMLWLAHKNEDASQIHKAEYCTARIASALGDKATAERFIKQALAHSRAENDSVYILKNIFLRGKIHADFGEYLEATPYYVQAKDLVKNDPDQTRFHIISHSIALIKNQVNDVRNAIEISKKNLRFFETKDETAFYPLTINSLILLGSAYTKLAIKHLNKPELHRVYIDSSMIYIEDGMKIAEKYGDKEAKVMLAGSKGLNFYELGDFKACLEILKIAEQQSIEQELMRELPMTYLYQGKSYYSLQQYNKAILHLEKAYEASKELKIDFPNLQETLFLLAKSYSEVGDTKKAIQYYDLFYDKDKENEQMANITSKTLYEKYDIPSFENQIRKLKNESKRIGNKYTYTKYIAWSLLVAFISILFFYIKRQYQYKKRFEKLLVHINTLEQQKEISKATPAQKETNRKKPKIADEKVAEILKNLEKFERKELFLSNKCTLTYVAKKVNTNSTYFSIILQEHKKKKFVQYLSDLRIEYVLKRLKNDPVFRSYDIKSIAQEVGFNTAESFSKAFKKRTGIYPSFFIKSLDKLNDS